MSAEPWIIVKPAKNKKIPEIRIEMSGRVFINGEPYNENDPRFRNISVNVETHNKLNTGEETRKMLELQKTAQKGEVITVSESKDKDKSESTIIKF
ncbi:MAG: hypothetical protein QM368_05470 [Bacillota bacterium]|jgi:hypothetical protein|nr:hypothetical protein [Bacillota bacterium]